MMVKNPKFKELCGQYNHLEGVNVSEENRDQIPVHVVLGASRGGSRPMQPMRMHRSDFHVNLIPASQVSIKTRKNNNIHI